MENEIITRENEDEILDPAEENEDSGRNFGIGLGLLIGSGLTLAAVAGVNKLRKVWRNHKAKKNSENSKNSSDGDNPDVIIINDENFDETK